MSMACQRLLGLLAYLKILAAEDQSGARPAQRFVRGGGGDMRVGHRRGMRPAGDEAGDVRHIEDVHRADLVGDLAHAREIPQARICAGAADDDLGLFAHGDGFEFVVVDDFCVAPDSVKGRAVELAAEAQLVAVGKVAAMGQVEAENGVAGLQHRHVGRGVGLRAGVGLHVGKLGGEYLFGAIAGEVFDHVGVFAAAVVAAAWIALGVLIGEDGARGLEHCFRHKVFAGNHFQPFVLAEGFVVNGGGYGRVGLGQGKGHAISHTPILRQDAAGSCANPASSRRTGFTSCAACRSPKASSPGQPPRASRHRLPNGGHFA